MARGVGSRGKPAANVATQQGSTPGGMSQSHHRKHNAHDHTAGREPHGADRHSPRTDRRVAPFTPLPIFDHHAHLDDPGATLADVRSGVERPGVVGAVSAGYGPERSAVARARIGRFSGLSRAVGLHPWWLATHPPERWAAAWQQVAAELAAPDVVAVGEIGLDRSRRRQVSQQQQEQQLCVGLDLARAHDLPVVFHVVGWHGHALRVLDAQQQGGGLPRGGVVHGFSGAVEVARAYQDLGLYLSVGPHLRRRPLAAQRALIDAIALDRLLVESDWPQERQPWRAALDEVEQLIRLVAEVHHLPTHAAAEVLVANARRLYGLG